MIEAAELVAVHVSGDGKSLRLRMRDRNGQMISLSLPACWLNEMLNAMPRSHDAETVRPLDSWSMDRIGNGRDLVLTLRTPEGQAVSFAIKPWQVEGMATIATRDVRAINRPDTSLALVHSTLPADLRDEIFEYDALGASNPQVEAGIVEPR